MRRIFRIYPLRLPSRRVLLRVFASVLLFFVLFILWVSRDLPTAETFAQRTVPQSTLIYDRTGKVLLYDLHGDEKRTLVSIAQIAPSLVNATVVAEDDQFYHHIGIDIPGIIRAFFTNIFSGRLEQGGSTITQQLVRSAVLTRDKTFARKIREVILSLEIEAKFSKTQILEAYLNQISYGSLIYGVEAASQSYFGKSSRDLSLAEAATIAALPKSPSFYVNHQDELAVRKNYILDRMVTLGYIDVTAAEQAKSETVKLSPPREAITAPHFVFYVQEELERRFGKDRVEQGGLKVITSLDANLQKIAEDAVRTGAQSNERRFRATNAALVALNPNSGEILTMVGSRDYFDVAHDGNVNVTTRQRQPGSSFKPVVYATAFERGFTPDTILFDLPTDFGGGYAPQNYTGKTYGPVTARQALANSLNIASVKMLWLAGIQESIAMAQRLGITTLTEDPGHYGLSLVLGGGAVTLLEESSAFGTFAADGSHVAPEALLSVEDTAGATLYTYSPKPEAVLDKQIARQITDILSDNDARSMVFGTQTPLTLGARPVAAKTGTAQDFRDAWTVGYTPSLVAGVWVGNNDYSPMARGADGSVVAAPIWNKFMRGALSGTPMESFTKPVPVLTGKPVLDGDWAGTQKVLIDRASGKRATDLTPPDWIAERDYQTIHDTLFWVDRTDPRGDPPNNPYNDPQFANWESAVQQWVASDPERAALVNTRPPDAVDDIHVPENVPRLDILSPQPQEVFRNAPALSVFVHVAASFGIESVAASLDGAPERALLQNTSLDRYEAALSLPSSRSSRVSEHTITVRAFDIYGNRGEKTVTVLFPTDE